MNNMIPELANTTHHPVIKELCQLLCNKTQNTDTSFFKAIICFYLGQMASCMRAKLITKDRGEVPVNMYTIALATSGFGKGLSTSIMEGELVLPFKRRFLNETMPEIATAHMEELARDKALISGTEEQEEFDRLEADYKRAGEFAFVFDSGTAPAIKQMRSKLILANCGSINLAIDEISQNLLGATEALNLYLELYDQGLTKQKLTKNTQDSVRSADIDGKTPSNMLLFGTPVKLFDGSIVEDQFYAFLEMGYARRCVFGQGVKGTRAYETKSAQEIFTDLINPKNDYLVQKWACKFEELADSSKMNFKIEVPDDVSIKLLEYRIACEKLADSLPDHEEIRKAELSHRYFKALKLAGAFAFVDEVHTLDLNTLLQAILLVEESGESFKNILSREKAYMKLAKYIASTEAEVTHADLTETLPFYKGSVSARNEMMTLATAWGYKHNILIKKSYADGIEFFTGDSLKETNLNEIIVSCSDDLAYGYTPYQYKFEDLQELMINYYPGSNKPIQWCSHAFEDGHRCEANVIPEFNMVVFDIDGGTQIETARDLLKDYTYIIYSTKRSTPENNRFRLVLPINYHLKLDSDEYKEFMENLAGWLPFKGDDVTYQRSRKWEGNPNGDIFYNEGQVLDILKFIPKTSKNEQYKETYKAVESLSNLERWFATRIAEGNRNNNMLKYALALVDGGFTLQDVISSTKAFNKKLKNPLPVEELEATVFKTVAQKYLDK